MSVQYVISSLPCVNFRATVSTTVPRFAQLSDCRLVCLYEALVYCGQTVGWIMMKLGTEVVVDTSHIAACRAYGQTDEVFLAVWVYSEVNENAPTRQTPTTDEPGIERVQTCTR